MRSQNTNDSFHWVLLVEATRRLQSFGFSNATFLKLMRILYRDAEVNMATASLTAFANQML